MSRQLLEVGRVRRSVLLAAALGLAALVGCGGNGLSSAGLFDPLVGRGRGAVDGFVFVPARSRQNLTGIVPIPHANVQVFQLPRTPGDTPLGTGQADGNGKYRIEGLLVNVPMVVIATDPFGLPGQPARTVSGVVSFAEGELEKTKNLSEATSAAAAVVQQRSSDVPLSDAQLNVLEQLAQDAIDQALLDNPDFDVTANADQLQQLAQQLAVQSFGSLLVRVFSQPAAVSAAVLVNGKQVGSVVTAPATPSRLEANELRVADLAIGLIVVRIRATGFQEVVKNVTIVGGQEVELVRTLVPNPAEGENQPPVIASLQAVPPFLPFQGGTTVIQADIGDPDGDPVSATATVLKIGGVAPSARQDGTTVFATLNLTNVNGTFSAPVTVPGNPATFNQTYQVVVAASDGTGSEPTEGTIAFQVSGVNPPPAEPPSTRTLTGVVTNRVSADPLPDATVSGGGQSVQTGADGSYALSGLPVAGSVLVLFAKDGFISAPVTVTEGQNILNVALLPVITVRTAPPPPTLQPGTRDQAYQFSGLLDTLGLTVVGPISTSGLVSNGVAMARWDPVQQTYVTSVTQFETGVGYWVQSLSPDLQIFSGSPVPSNFAISLVTGFNLVSVPFESTIPLNPSSVSVRVAGETKNLLDAFLNGWIDPYAIGWDPDAGAYFVVSDPALAIPNSVASIEPGRAYWFFCNVPSAELLLTPPAAR